METKVRNQRRPSWSQKPRIESERAETRYSQGQKRIGRDFPCNGQCKLKIVIDFKGTKQGWGSVLLPVEEKEQEYASAVWPNLVHADPPKLLRKRSDLL